MARTNWHDSVYKDPNYPKLLLEVGCVYRTKGMLITAWELAQTHWIEHQGVPVDKWPEEFSVLVKHKFAREIDRGTEGMFIYVSGSSEHCSFLDKQAKNGRKGGRSKSPTKLQNLKQFRSQTEAKPKPNRSQNNPTEVSISSSISNSIIPFSSKTGEVAPTPPAERNPVALWIKAYQSKYGVRYALQKKDFGILKSFGSQYGPDQIELLFACYLAIEQPLYREAKHPLSLFFRDLQKISVAAQTGVNPAEPKRFDVSNLKD